MERTVSQKLEALYKLQLIDSDLDELIKIRGALPEEVGDLEDEIAGYETRIQKHQGEIEIQDNEINANKAAIKNSEKLIKKYEEQQMNVRNNREYDAITKETELQQLEIQICEKRIKEAYVRIEAKKEEIEHTQARLDERKKDLDSKKAELDQIISESEDEEKKLLAGREKAAAQVEERLIKSYNKIRKQARNGLVIVKVLRNACGGCFNIVPPQRQAEVRERKKVIVCEHCGRIFYDVEDIVEEEPKKTTRKAKAV
ncbi:MAG: zinc ribbon domain-containing protein [Cyclobacteriaceae bacterium]